MGTRDPPGGRGEPAKACFEASGTSLPQRAAHWVSGSTDRACQCRWGPRPGAGAEADVSQVNTLLQSGRRARGGASSACGQILRAQTGSLPGLTAATLPRGSWQGKARWFLGRTEVSGQDPPVSVLGTSGTRELAFLGSGASPVLEGSQTHWAAEIGGLGWGWGLSGPGSAHAG